MGTVQVELDQDLVDLLEELGLGREQFIRQASERGIPYFQLDGEDLQRELDASKKL
jgi:hypothetical protein